MEKSMQVNFQYLKERILDTNNVSNLLQIKEQLSAIRGNTICIGSGGSGVVSEFASKVLGKKNDCLAISMEPRDILYTDIRHFKNVLACSYSGDNFGVQTAFNNDLNHYLLTNSSIDSSDVNTIQYKTVIDEERSFVSLAATLMPMSILLNYYLNRKQNQFKELINELFNNIDNMLYSFKWFSNNKTIEIMSGKDTIVAEEYLRSTLVEAGLASPVAHHKYNYCHGGTTLAFNNANNLIYLEAICSDIDGAIINEIEDLYQDTIMLRSNYKDPVIDNFYLTLQTMYLTKHLAEIKNADLSAVKYAPAVKRLYKFKGTM